MPPLRHDVTVPSTSAELLGTWLAATASASSNPLRRALFGTTEPALIAGALERAITPIVGELADVAFLRDGVGLVIGLELVDGGPIVVKVHRWNVSPERLAAIQRVQSQLAAAGLPAPRPVSIPLTIGGGIATIETLLEGATADGHDPAVRRSLAAGLARFVDGTRAVEPEDALGSPVLWPSDGGLWGEPHDLRFDFDRTTDGAGWIDALARGARRVLDAATLDAVVVHLDWRVENLAFDGSEIVAIYDWDSVGATSEAVAVGQAAAQFSTDWRVGPSSLPDVDEMARFVVDYETARARPFDPDELEVVDASNLWLCAYGARCQHSDRALHPDVAGPVDAGWIPLLAARGADGLRRALGRT